MAHSLSNIIDLTNAPTPPRWFEFLLEPGRLQQHLETNSCDPSPIELITLFFRNIPSIETNLSHSSPNQKNPLTSQTNSISPSTNGNSPPSPSGSSSEQQEKSTEKTKEDTKVVCDFADKLIVDFIPSAEGNIGSEVHIPPDSYEAKYRAKKAYALQTLAIKVASFVDWDLNLICNNLTIPTQYKLMQSLNLACSSNNCPTEVKMFSNIIYWHWFLKTAISYQLSVLQPQSNNTTIIYLSQLQQQQQAAESSALFSMGELFTPKSKQLKACSTQLHSYIWELSHNKDNSPKKAKGSYHPFKKAKLSAPLMECFDSTDDQFNDWTKCRPIETRAFLEAACYDLGKFFFFEESYKLAEESFEIIRDSAGEFPKLLDYLNSATGMLNKEEEEDTTQKNGSATDKSGDYMHCDLEMDGKKKTEKYLFDCMTEFRKSQKKEDVIDEGSEEFNNDLTPGQDSDLRIEQNNAWYGQVPATILQQQAFEAAKGGAFMSQGDFKQAMGCFVGSLMLMTDYFRIFSKGYVEEEPYINRMIQCSISLSCFTQAVALCQMTKNINYTMAFKQLNERVCNDCCDDIYECIWNVTLLEYIINLHSKRGEVERRTNVIQLIGQLELNENNPEEILREAEHVRRGKFFRIMSNKYL